MPSFPPVGEVMACGDSSIFVTSYQITDNRGSGFAGGMDITLRGVLLPDEIIHTPAVQRQISWRKEELLRNIRLN